MMVVPGQIHHEVMGGDWPQTGEGMAEFVLRLPDILTKLLGTETPWPRVIFSDRGPGMFQGSTGHIVKKYAAALKLKGFRTYQGEDASSQPADLADAFPHETAAAWTRTYMQKHPFDRRGSLDVQESRLEEVFKNCSAHANANYDVAGLCSHFPNRW